MLSCFSSYSKYWSLFTPAFRAFSKIDTFAGHVPPVWDDSLTGRYATVLFSQASKNNQLSRVLEDVEFLKDFSKQNEMFKTFSTNAGVSLGDFKTVAGEL